MMIFDGCFKVMRFLGLEYVSQVAVSSEAGVGVEIGVIEGVGVSVEVLVGEKKREKRTPVRMPKRTRAKLIIIILGKLDFLDDESVFGVGRG